MEEQISKLRRLGTPLRPRASETELNELRIALRSSLGVELPEPAAVLYARTGDAISDEVG